jgi:hypothetical protein
MSPAKFPRVPAGPLRFDPGSDVRVWRGPLWSIFATVGPHALAWNELRHFGPATGMRFDPHPLPPGVHDVGVMYCATGPVTAFAEVFQASRRISRSELGRTLVSFTPARDLQLLDLTANWPVKNGGAASMQMGPKRHTQNWAREIQSQLGDRIDGLWHYSSLTSEPMVTLFSRAEVDSIFETYPESRVALADAMADLDVYIAASELGYDVGP